jgi:hypothetical protein
MDSQKSRRRSRWLSKVLCRENSATSSLTSNALNPDAQLHDAGRSGQASQDGTAREGDATTLHTNVESLDSQGGVAVPASPSEHAKPSEARDLEERLILSANQPNDLQVSTNFPDTNYGT